MINQHVYRGRANVNVKKTKYIYDITLHEKKPTSKTSLYWYCRVRGDVRFHLSRNYRKYHDITQESQGRIMIVTRALFGLSRVFKSKFVRRHTKRRSADCFVGLIASKGITNWQQNSHELLSWSKWPNFEILWIKKLALRILEPFSVTGNTIFFHL